MVEEARQNEEKDKARKSSIEAKNEAETLIYRYASCSFEAHAVLIISTRAVETCMECTHNLDPVYSVVVCLTQTLKKFVKLSRRIAGLVMALG